MTLTARGFVAVVEEVKDGGCFEVEHLALETLRERRQETEDLVRDQVVDEGGEFFRPWERVVAIAQVEVVEKKRFEMPDERAGSEVPGRRRPARPARERRPKESSRTPGARAGRAPGDDHGQGSLL